MSLFRFFRDKPPKLDWIQVEVTSGCDGDCIYCPRHVYKKQWNNRQMTLDKFRSLKPAFKKADLVHLQGWGEPLLHPEIREMVKIVKDCRAKAGTTTNANRLNPSMAEGLVKSGLNIIGFSLAGISAEKNDSIRRGTRLDSVIGAIENLHQAKRKLQSAYPDIHMAYMLLNSNLDELEDMPDFFAKLKVNQVVVSSLSLICSPDLKKESMLAETELQWEELMKRVEKVQEDAVKKGVDMHFQLVSPLIGPKPCEENVSRALVVDAGGEVSPCVLANVPVDSGCTYCFGQEEIEFPKLRFGNSFEQPLGRIWRDPDYRKFRKRHLKGDLPSICQKCYKSYVVTKSPHQGIPAGGLV